MIEDSAALAQHIRAFLEEFSTNTGGLRAVLIIAGDTSLNVVSDSLDVADVAPLLYAAYTGALEELARRASTPKGEMH